LAIVLTCPSIYASDYRFDIFKLFLSISGFLFSRKVCYDHIGCFSNSFPYNNAHGNLPESPDHIQTQFLLYTRQNPHQEKLLDPYDHSTIKHSHFDGSKKTVLITHGYQDDGRSTWIHKMTTELLKKVG
jgi:hypothetical protein